jgi:sugar/nucleoside kinase (ribokinase family)
MEKKFDLTVCGVFVADIIGRPINLKSDISIGGLRMIDEIKLFTGGLGCNLAIDVAKLGFKVAVMGRLSNDNWKALFTSAFDEVNIDYSSVIPDNTLPSAATVVCVDASGERTFFHVGGTIMGLKPDDIISKIETIRNSKYFALGYYGCMPALEPDLPLVLKELKEKTETRLLLETAGFVKPTLDDLSRSLPYLDYWVPSYEEGKILTGKDDYKEMIKVFREAGASKVVGIKLGSEGCYLTEPGNEYYIPSFKVNKVVDTTGAGDSFIGGLFAGQIKGLGLRESGRFGNMVGALAVQSLGASTGIKTYEETLKHFEGK